jgi:hypothetical protein
LHQATAFYLPGIAPTYFKLGDNVTLHVNALQAYKSVLPYDQYYERLHFCQPATIQYDGENLGSVLMGDRLKNSKFKVRAQIIHVPCIINDGSSLWDAMQHANCSVLHPFLNRMYRLWRT